MESAHLKRHKSKIEKKVFNNDTCFFSFDRFILPNMPEKPRNKFLAAVKVATLLKLCTHHSGNTSKSVNKP